LIHLSYLEAAVIGLVQGVSEMFPVSSLGHAVLIPALIGGQWAKDLNVAAASSSYLAFIVGLHVATAAALLVYFRRDWIRLIRAFFTSLSQRRVATADQKLAWMIVLATIPVGIVGAAGQKTFQSIFGHPLYAAAFLAINGVILLAAERFRRRSSIEADEETELQREWAQMYATGRHSNGARAQRQRELAAVTVSDRRLATLGYPQGILIGSAQILALLAGISRDGVAMVAGTMRGLSREDAARFAFLLATPVILAADALKLPELAAPETRGIRGPILLGSILAGVGAYAAVRFLLRYLRTRTLTPFGIYCLVAGLASLGYLGLVK
jgi:undecaprenyl-diphosphatase